LLSRFWVLAYPLLIMERLLAPSGGLFIGMAAAITYAFVALTVTTLDRFRPGSTSKDDTQNELKILLFALSLVGLSLAAGGVTDLVATIAGGFKGGVDAIKHILAPIVVGAGVLAAMLLAFLPRTNSATARGPEALALLTVGLYFGGSAIFGGYEFINGLVMSAAWAETSAGLALVIVHGAIGVLAITRLGALAGWTAPVRPPPQYPPQGGGYPPQGGGYPPQGGGYPPQGGGYPPQGGGYPPQGGGYPPQGGGYPPQGGGYPPR
jgi:hypothetical protein